MVKMINDWTVVSESPRVIVTYAGGVKYGIYQQGADGYDWTARAMYNSQDDNEPQWCDLVKPVVCPSLGKAVAQVEQWQAQASA